MEDERAALITARENLENQMSRKDAVEAIEAFDWSTLIGF
jgi:hypothetical protein